MDVTFTVDASRPLQRLDALYGGLTDATKEPLRSGFVRAGLLYFQDMRTRFASASAGDGTWKPLAPSTIQKKKGDTRILIRTGALFNDVPPPNFNRAMKVTKDGLQVFIPNKIAGYHQRGNAKLPQRKIFVEPRPAARAAMIQAIQQAVNKVIAINWPNQRPAA